MKKYQRYNFENLEIYQLSCDFVMTVYQVTSRFPKQEQYGLTSQVRRAVISIVLNIVEGSGRASKKDFSRFISQAIGSILEVKAGLILAGKIGYLTKNEFSKLAPSIDEIYFKLLAFKKSLSKDS